MPIPPVLTFHSLLDVQLYLETLWNSFDHAAAEASDTSATGRQGNHALDIDTAPVVSYVAGSETMEVMFTLPGRATRLTVLYRRLGTEPFSSVSFTASPGIILGLKQGSVYKFQAQGVASNGLLGPKTPLVPVAVPLTFTHEASVVLTARAITSQSQIVT